MHSVETQEIIQVIPAPGSGEEGRLGLVLCLGGYTAPSSERGGKMKKVNIGLVRGGKPGLEVGLGEDPERSEEVEEDRDADVPSVSI